VQAVIADSFSGAADNSKSKSESQSQVSTAGGTASHTEAAIGSAIRRRITESQGMLPTPVGGKGGEDGGGGGGGGGVSVCDRSPPVVAHADTMDRSGTPSAWAGDDDGIDKGVGGSPASHATSPLLPVHVPTPAPQTVAVTVRDGDADGIDADGAGEVRAVSVHDDIRDEVTARKQRLATGLKRRFSTSESDGAPAGVVVPVRARAIIHDAAEAVAHDGDSGSRRASRPTGHGSAAVTTGAVTALTSTHGTVSRGKSDETRPGAAAAVSSVGKGVNKDRAAAWVSVESSDGDGRAGRLQRAESKEHPLPASPSVVTRAGEVVVAMPPARFPGEGVLAPLSAVEMTPVMSPSGVGVAVGHSSSIAASPVMSIGATSVTTLSNRTVPGAAGGGIGGKLSGAAAVTGNEKSVLQGGVGLSSSPGPE
jgi:hypothetical protein